jgi:hypothetical protein
MALWRHKDTVIDPKAYIYRISKSQAEKTRELGQRYDLWGMPIALEKAAR